VLVERPTYDRPRKILPRPARARRGRRRRGRLDVDELAALRAASLLYHDPTFQNPTGISLSLERRRRLAELARDRSLAVLEDDPYGLVRFEEPSRCERLRARRRRARALQLVVFEDGRTPACASVRDRSQALAGSSRSWWPRRTSPTALLAQAAVHEFLRRGLLEPSLSGSADCCARAATPCWRRSSVSFPATLAGTGRKAATSSGSTAGRVDASELLARATEAGVTFVAGADFGGPPSSAGSRSASSRPRRSTRACGGWRASGAGGGAGIAARAARRAPARAPTLQQDQPDQRDARRAEHEVDVHVLVVLEHEAMP
jgi:hypothetical protein